MIDNERQDALIKKVERANTGLRITALLAAVVLFVTLGFLVAQGFSLQRQLDGQLKAQQEAALRNHQRTQQYVKCIANVLLKPLSQRQETDFDECGITGTTDTRTQQSVSPQATEQSGSRNTPAPAAPAPAQPTPQPIAEQPAQPIQETTPDPEPRKAILGIPLVDNVLYGLFRSE